MRADLASPPGKPFEDARSLLVGVLVADTRPQRLHIVDRLDARVEEVDVRGFEPLFGREAIRLGRLFGIAHGLSPPLV